jgi:hypothetical protein
LYKHNWYHSNVSSIPLYMYIHEHRLQYTWRSPLASSLPLLVPLCSTCNPLLLTWNPPSCDRIRPPRSQVACKLTSPVPTLSPNPPPSNFPEPRLPSASLRRPQEHSGVFCPEQEVWSSTPARQPGRRSSTVTRQPGAWDSTHTRQQGVYTQARRQDCEAKHILL